MSYIKDILGSSPSVCKLDLTGFTGFFLALNISKAWLSHLCKGRLVHWYFICYAEFSFTEYNCKYDNSVQYNGHHCISTSFLGICGIIIHITTMQSFIIFPPRIIFNLFLTESHVSQAGLELCSQDYHEAPVLLPPRSWDSMCTPHFLGYMALYMRQVLY